MSDSASQTLEDSKIELPALAGSVKNYIPVKRTDLEVAASR